MPMTASTASRSMPSSSVYLGRRPRAQLGIVERDGGVEAGIGEARQLASDLGIEPERDLAEPEPHQLVGPDPDAARRGTRPAGVTM